MYSIFNYRRENNSVTVILLSLLPTVAGLASLFKSNDTRGVLIVDIRLAGLSVSEPEPVNGVLGGRFPVFPPEFDVVEMVR